MVASITLLPALLGFVGRNIDKFKLPGTGKMRDPRTTAGYRWSHFLQRHPWPFAALGLLVLIGLALPVVSHPPRLVRREQLPDHRRPPAGPTTSRPRASVPAPAARCCSPPRSTAPQDLAHPPEGRRRGRGHARCGPGQPAPAQRGRSTPPSSRSSRRPRRRTRRRSTLLEHLRDDVLPAATEGTDVAGPRRRRHRGLRRRGHQAAGAGCRCSSASCSASASCC